jgi:hypothetical protein
MNSLNSSLQSLATKNLLECHDDVLNAATEGRE